MDQSYGIIPYFRNTENRIEFLIIQHISGHRGLPKGHKEAGESNIQAAMRELQEETGITANQVDETQIFTEQYSFTREDKTIDKQVTYFLGNIDKNHIITIQESEIIDYKVASFSESTKILSYKTTKNVLSEAYSYLCTYHKSP